MKNKDLEKGKEKKNIGLTFNLQLPNLKVYS